MSPRLVHFLIAVSGLRLWCMPLIALAPAHASSAPRVRTLSPALTATPTEAACSYLQPEFTGSEQAAFVPAACPASISFASD